MRIGNLSKGLCLALCAGALAILPARAEPATGKVSQPLVTANPAVSVFDRERLGLIVLSNALGKTMCSGSLISNLWVLTAAHCIENVNGGTISPPAVITIRANWRTIQDIKAVELVYFRPADVALVRLEKPMRVFGSERRFEAELWRPNDGSLLHHGIRVYGAGSTAFAKDESTKVQGGDDDYRWLDTSIASVRPDEYSMPGSSTDSILWGDSGGPSYFDRKITGVHSHMRYDCVEGIAKKDCDKQWAARSKEMWDASVAQLTPAIDAAIQRTAPPQWSDMIVRRSAVAVVYTRPTVRVENDDYRLDVCRRFAADCGKPAADAYCAAHVPEFNGHSEFETEPFGHTAVGTTGQTCFGQFCQAFKKISCLFGFDPVMVDMKHVPVDVLEAQRAGQSPVQKTVPAVRKGWRKKTSTPAPAVKDDAVLLPGARSAVTDTFDPKSRYTGVRMERGNVQTTAPNVEDDAVLPPGAVVNAPSAQPAPPQPRSAMTGTFDTDLGVLVLAGNEGTYSTLNGRVTVTGIAGDVMDGTWTTSWSTQRCADGAYRGHFRFTFDPAGFTGAYGFCDGPPTAGVWNGTRR